MTTFIIQNMGLEVRQNSDFLNYEKIRLVPLFIDSNYINGIPEIVLERSKEENTVNRVWVSKVCPEIRLKRHVIFAIMDTSEKGIGSCIWSIGAENYNHSNKMMIAKIPGFPGCLLWASGKINPTS